MLWGKTGSKRVEGGRNRGKLRKNALEKKCDRKRSKGGSQGKRGGSR